MDQYDSMNMIQYANMLYLHTPLSGVSQYLHCQSCQRTQYGSKCRIPPNVPIKFYGQPQLVWCAAQQGNENLSQPREKLYPAKSHQYPVQPLLIFFVSH